MAIGKSSNPLGPGKWSSAFLSAARRGDIAALESMFTADIVSVADGGGTMSTARHPIADVARVARGPACLFHRDIEWLELTIEEVDGAPARVRGRVDARIRLADLRARQFRGCRQRRGCA